MSLDSNVLFFFFGAEIYKLEILKNLPPIAKISTREVRSFSARENKYTRKLVRLRYVN